MSVALQLLVRLSSTDFPHTSGSLNLVLANKNGFVIAALLTPTGQAWVIGEIRGPERHGLDGNLSNEG